MWRQLVLTLLLNLSVMAHAEGAKPVAIDGLDLTGLTPRAPVLADDGQTLWFTSGKTPQIYEARRSGDGWSKPELATFSDQGANWEPYLTADERHILFVSSRVTGSNMKGQVFIADRSGAAWGKPRPLFILDDPAGLWFPNGDPKGTVYVSGELQGQAGKSDLYAIDLSRGAPVVNRLTELSSEHIEWDPYVSRDGQWMVFVSDRPGGSGKTDLWLSRRQPDGQWGAPFNAGPKINSGSHEVAAIFSPDGKTLYFVKEPDQVFEIKVHELTTP